MATNKLNPEDKAKLMAVFPLMVGDIDPEEHKRRMEILQAVRTRIEAGETDAAPDKAAAVDIMILEEATKKPKKVKP